MLALALFELYNPNDTGVESSSAYNAGVGNTAGGNINTSTIDLTVWLGRSYQFRLYHQHLLRFKLQFLPLQLVM